MPEKLPTPKNKEQDFSSDVSALEATRKGVNRIVAHELPKAGYESTMKVYGGHFAYDKEGRLVYDPRDIQSRAIDIPGDRILRAYDEHHVKEPGKLLRRHPKALLKSLPFKVDSKRYRGTMEDTQANIEKFGLQDY